MIVEIDQEDISEVQSLKGAIHEIKAFLNENNVPLDSSFKVEYSHHYGVAKFRETGAVLIECVNRDYCKKIIVQLAGQQHPSHYHSRKEETFHVLHGVLFVELDKKVHRLGSGQILLIQPGVWHSFWTETGVIFEEISTTHFNGDSFYADKAINRMERASRKTVVDHWGRFQLSGGGV